MRILRYTRYLHFGASVRFYDEQCTPRFPSSNDVHTLDSINHFVVARMFALHIHGDPVCVLRHSSCSLVYAVRVLTVQLDHEVRRTSLDEDKVCHRRPFFLRLLSLESTQIFTRKVPPDSAAFFRQLVLHFRRVRDVPVLYSAEQSMETTELQDTVRLTNFHLSRSHV